MRRALLVFCLFGFAAPLFAIDTTCDATVTQLGALYEIRSLMMKGYGSSYEVGKVIDRRLDELRGPLPDGGYRWVRWVRPGGEGPFDKKGHTVLAVHDRGDADSFEASGDHIYAVRIAVPQKKSLFGANKPVYVGTAHLTYTIDGRRKTKEQAINQWMNPDTTKTIDLEGIADHVEATLDASTAEKDSKQALVELHFRQAVAQDDPSNPAYPAIKSLLRVRSFTDPATVDDEIATAERKLFPESDPVPVLSILKDLREADTLLRSSKTEEQEKGTKLMKETLRRLK